MRIFFIILIFFVILNSCSQNDRKLGFYYWKSNTIKTTPELQMLKNVKAQKLYVKFFEVISENGKDLIPIDKTDFAIKANTELGAEITQAQASNFKNIEIIPTVFVKNTSLLLVNKEKIEQLAANMVKLVKQTFENNIGPLNKLNELQIDCDWTPKTKLNYFYLLSCIKNKIKARISCTLRLYPFKYPQEMGTPPVDRCMLMCYNLISPTGNPSKNSILDLAELTSYVKGVKKYPISLDIALPVFSWIHHYKQDQFSGLIQTGDTAFLESLIQEKKTMWYFVSKDCTIDEKLIRAGERVKWEKIDVNILQKAIVIMKENVHLETNSTLTFFDLNPTFCTQFSDENITSLHASFSN